MKKYPAPRLVPLDMSKSKEHQHPDINGRDTFLCLIGGDYFVGQFSKQWYGWNFNNWLPGSVGLQFDAPGWNKSGWQQIWKLVKR